MHSPLRTLLKVVTLALILCAPLAGQEILILGLNGDLHSIDPDTGQATYIGSTGFHTYFWSALAQDSQGRLFASTGDDLVGYSIYEIDPQTGSGTIVVQTNLFGIGCMAFGPGDVLYVGNDRTFPLSLSPYDLYTLDLNTGLATFLGDTGIRNMLAMDFNQGTLYGYPADIGLAILDTNTGVATDVNPSFRGPNGATVSMCFDDEGTLYYIDNILWMMDPATGVASEVGDIFPFGYWNEAVFVEGAQSHFSLWLAGTTNGPVAIQLAGASPGSQIVVAWANGAGGPTPIPLGYPCAGTLLDLNNTMRVAGQVTADVDGKATLGPQLVPSAAIGQIHLQAIDLSTCRISNKLIISY